MPRTWKSALAPFLAGIPERTGLVGEWRFGLLNDLRFGERKRPRMIDQCAALALPQTRRCRRMAAAGARVPAAEVAGWRERLGLADHGRPVVALAPGAVGPRSAGRARRIARARASADRAGLRGLGARRPRRERRSRASSATIAPEARDLTGTDLRNAILALAAANVASRTIPA